MDLYISKHKIKEIKDSEKLGYKMISFEDREDLEIAESLLNLVQSQAPNEGTIMDLVNHKLAFKYLIDMSDYGLEAYNVIGVTNSMVTLINNLSNQKIADRFGVSHPDRILIKDIVDETK